MHLPSLAQRLTSERNQAAAATHNNTHRFSGRTEIVKDAERLARGKQYIYEGLESGALKPIIDRTFTLNAIVDAHRYMESNQQKGKIVVTV